MTSVVVALAFDAVPRASAQSSSAPRVVAGSASLIAAGTTDVAEAWTIRPPGGGWSGGDRIEIQVGPPTARLPKSACRPAESLVFASVPAVEVDGGKPGVEAAFAEGTCVRDTVVLTFLTAGSGTVRLSGIRYVLGDALTPGLVSVRASWEEVGFDDVSSSKTISATPNARVARTATLFAVSRPSIDIGDEGSAGSWRLTPDDAKRWEAGEVVTVEVSDASEDCGDGGHVGFASVPSAENAEVDIVVTVSDDGPGQGCRLNLSLRPLQATAAGPIQLSGVRLVTTAGAREGPISVAAASTRTIIDDDKAANAVLVRAGGPTSSTTLTSTTSTPGGTVAGSTTTTLAERDSASAGGVAALAALVVLALIGTALVARRLIVRRPAADLSALADRYLGRRRGPDLSDAGPAARRVSQLLGGRHWADPLLATVLWDAFAVDQLGATPVVVRHADGTRHDLFVLDPGYSGRRPRTADVELDPSGYDATAVARRLGVDPGLLQTALHEAARVGRFRVLVAPAPRTAPLAGPAGAAFAVEVAGRRMATTGVCVPGPRAVFTTALHAVAGMTDISVDGRAAVVTAEHVATDSCLLDVPDGTPAPRWDNAGPLRGLSPRQNESVQFFGASSGVRVTQVTGWDVSILAAQEVVGSKVYTPPDTAPGDSGAALVDSEGHVLGFAVYVTGLGEVIQYSAWVWADQVFRALRIVGPAS